jgi:hypothetical protein
VPPRSMSGLRRIGRDRFDRVKVEEGAKDEVIFARRGLTGARRPAHSPSPRIN